MPTKNRKLDRHDPSTRLIRAWANKAEIQEFYDACALQAKTASEVIRLLMSDFVKESAKGDRHE